MKEARREVAPISLDDRKLVVKKLLEEYGYEQALVN